MGSPFGWRGPDQRMYTSGTILELEPQRLLKHDLRDLKDREKLLSVITYVFEDNKGTTKISATEALNYEMTDDQFKEALEGWDLALRAVKETAEKL